MLAQDSETIILFTIKQTGYEQIQKYGRTDNSAWVVEEDLKKKKTKEEQILTALHQE